MVLFSYELQFDMQARSDMAVNDKILTNNNTQTLLRHSK